MTDASLSAQIEALRQEADDSPSQRGFNLALDRVLALLAAVPQQQTCQRHMTLLVCPTCDATARFGSYVAKIDTICNASLAQGPIGFFAREMLAVLDDAKKDLAAVSLPQETPKEEDFDARHVESETGPPAVVPRPAAGQDE